VSIVLDPEIKPLKLMSKIQLREFMNWFLSECSKELGKPCHIQNIQDQSIGTIDIETPKDGELFLNKLGMKSFHYMNTFIKEKMSADPKDYRRDLLLFESEIRDNQILVKF